MGKAKELTVAKALEKPAKNNMKIGMT